MQRTRSTTRSAAKGNRSQSAAKKKVNQAKPQPITQKVEESSDEEPILVKKGNKRNQSPSPNKRSQSHIDAEAVYSKGTYVAFIDSGDSLEKFKIGQLVEDLREIDEEGLLDIYTEIAPLAYQKEVAKIPIFEYALVCDVTVTLEKPKKKGAKPIIKITKQQFNKVKKHMENTIKRIEQEEKDNQSDEDDGSESEDEEEEEEEEDEEDQSMVKDDEEDIKKRKMVRGRSSQTQQAKGKNQRKPSIAPSKSQKSTQNSKKVSAKSNKKEEVKGKKVAQKKGTAAKKGTKEEDDEDMDDEEDKKVEQSEEVEMIDTSKKNNKNRSKSKQPQKRKASVPKVGQKRLRTSKKKVLDDESGTPVEPSGDVDDGSFDEDEDSQPVKKRKVGGGKAKAEKKPKAKKPPKKPTEFKKGRWNPDVELVKEDKYKESPSSELFFDCCIRCNNKNIIRAAVTGNNKLLKAGIEAKDKISSLTAVWSADIRWTSMEIMVSQNLHEQLEILLHPKLKVPQHSYYDNERLQFYQKRVHNPQFLMNLVDSGMVSHMAYGTRVRKVQMTRGNRQGNNAFLEEIDNTQNPINYLNDEYFIKRMLYSATIDHETFKQIYKLHPNIESYLQNYAYESVRAGNRKIAYNLIKAMSNYPNFGFNNLHCEVLGDGDLEKFVKQSITKKANTNRDITPLHCACINPNPKYLKALLDMGPDLNTMDADLRKPVHYAAACEGPEPLKILIQQGVNLTDWDNQKVNALHIAAMTGRHENARLILQNMPQLINMKDKKGNNAMVFACKFGFPEVVKVLLEFKARVNAGCGLSRSTPLGWAATYGHYELCEFLLENKARVLGKDKFKRTPLIMAVRNGHTKVASLLLQRGSEWDHCDSSMNTPLHYASAYGWLDCIDLLLKVGANVNAQNSWKISPINIAMLKNHHGCVKRLLEEPNVDVNGKDEKGRTLIMLSLFVLDDESIDFISFLIRKGADLNLPDLEGQTSLHYIAKFQPKGHDTDGKINKAKYLKEVEIQKKVAQMLIQNGADLTLKDNRKRTPFSLCLEMDNAPLLQFLQDKVSINNEPDLFFAFSQKIFNVEYQKILEKLIKNDPPTKETINYLDDEGKTPFLAYIQSFVDKQDNLFTQIQNRINQQSYIYGNEKNRYNITNQDIFDKFADQTNFYTYNYNFSQEEKNQLTNEFFEKIIVQPFIKILEFIIQNGADVHAQVYKLKKFRDIEEQKRIQIAQLAEGKEIKIEKEENIKKRTEKLEELQKRGKAPRKARAGMGGPFGYQFQNAYNQNDNNNQSDVYDKINGEKVLREYGEKGLRNAIHLILQKSNLVILEFLLSQKINPDQPDYDEVTPFNFLSKLGINKLDKNSIETYNKLLDLEVRIDYPDRKGRTPFLNFYEKSTFDLAYQMLDMGANINQMDISGLYALKYALIRRQNNAIQELLDRGANINQIDNKGRNLLHHAINMSSATADATFETEQFLIERGVNLNLLDNKNRTPLHYAFVKIQDWKQSTQIDPIETVSSLCGCKGLQIDIPDKWLKTPLHYASQRGASICAMYLIQRTANIESKDIYGNTPLGVGLMNKHYNYGIILIQKQASVHPLVYREDYEKLKKQWEEEEKKQRELYRIQQKGSKAKLSQDHDMNGEEEKESPQKSEKTKSQKKSVAHKRKAHQNMFNGGLQNNYYNQYGDEYYVSEDEYDEEMEMYQHQENIFNQQNAFGMQVFAQPAKQPFANFGGNISYQFGNFGVPAQPKTIPNNPYANSAQLVDETDKEGVSMFKLAIRGAQQGLAYLMLDNGYDLMLAMQDAMDEKKFMLVLTLLSKNPDDTVIQKVNSKGQNLFHILSMNASSCGFEHLQRIYEALLKRGVNCKAKDSYGRTALHYALISNSLQLVKLLLSQDGYNPNEVDNEGFTPISLLLRGKSIQQSFYNPVALHIENIFLLLAKSGADVNIVYPEEEYKPDLKEEEVDEQFMNDYDHKGKYYSTLLINLIRSKVDSEIMRNNLIGLIEFGAKLNIYDSDGRDPIMHAIMNNDIMVLKILLENKKALNVNQKAQDKAGKSAAHYVVNPIRFGSYENVEILRLIHKYGFDLQLKDAQGKAPAIYAAQQESGILLKEIAQLIGKQEELERFNRQLSMIETQNWPEQLVDFEIDSEQYMVDAQQRETRLAKEQNQKIPVDVTGKFEKSYEVYYGEDDKPWDVYLTKVDLKNGIYGDYVFYKMQLLYDKNRDLYVVFTRWGRIGETGMNQRTPFNSVDDAKIEFKKIFKSKTGGNNFEELDAFSRVKKKYNLTRVNYVTTNFKEYLQPFDFEKCPKSRLSQDLYELFEEISNVTMFQRAITEYGIDQDVLPFSAVKKESLIESRQVLNEIQELIKEDIEISKEGIKADYDKLSGIKEKISELSSRFYELIPMSRYKNQIAPPLTHIHQIKQQYDMLEGLTNIEYASKILLGALYRQKEMNPIDYVYHALNIQIESLDNEGPEFDVINTYIQNTTDNDNMMRTHEISNIFKIQRKGEAEMIQAYQDVPNHFLLFHGSQLFNYMGILTQGLRIAPPEAPVTGYMFGKGVYFADMFSKSYAYAARGYQQQDSFLMILCEVVLGKQKEMYQAEYVEKLEPPYNSVKGMGRRGPAYKNTIVLPNGVKLPYGKVIDYHSKNQEIRKQLMLQHNEYIVYNTQQIRMRYLVQISKKDPKKNKN